MERVLFRLNRHILKTVFVHIELKACKPTFSEKKLTLHLKIIPAFRMWKVGPNSLTVLLLALSFMSKTIRKTLYMPYTYNIVQVKCNHLPVLNSFQLSEVAAKGVFIPLFIQIIYVGFFFIIREIEWSLGLDHNTLLISILVRCWNVNLETAAIINMAWNSIIITLMPWKLNKRAK